MISVTCKQPALKSLRVDDCFEMNILSAHRAIFGHRPDYFANISVNRPARKLRLRVPSALRAPATGYLKR